MWKKNALRDTRDEVQNGRGGGGFPFSFGVFGSAGWVDKMSVYLS